MLNIPSVLKDAIIDGRVCRYVKLSLVDGSIIGITDHETPIMVDGLECQPSPNLNAIQMLQTQGTQVNTQKIFSTWFEDIFDMDSLKAGLYDDADLEVGWVGWNTSSLLSMVIFSGKIGEITFNDEGLTVEALDDMKLLEDNFGRTYTTHDPYTFGDPQFGLDESAYTESGVVDYVLSNRLKFKASGSGFNSHPNAWFTFGKLTFTSGPNQGWSGEVKVHEVNTDINIGTSIELFLPTPFPMSVGDTFEVVAGYDGSFAQSRDKFNNIVNFGGFPHIQSVGEQ